MDSRHVESWLRRDGTVGHRIEVSERMDAIGELRYGCWVFEDGDEDTLRRSRQYRAYHFMGT
jgi:hypothetical protein